MRVALVGDISAANEGQHSRGFRNFGTIYCANPFGSCYVRTPH